MAGTCTPSPVGYLVSRNASLTKVEGSESDYYVKGGTTFTLQKEPYGNAEAASKQSEGPSGVLASKAEVILTATFLGQFVAVAEGTLFSFYPNDGGKPRTFQVKGIAVLHYEENLCQFTVVEEVAEFTVTEMTPELTVVLTYYFIANITDDSSPFSPQNIQESLEGHFPNDFETITVYVVRIDVADVAPYVENGRMIGLSVTIYGSIERPRDIQSYLQDDYFNNSNVMTGPAGSYSYNVLPPPTLDEP